MSQQTGVSSHGRSRARTVIRSIKQTPVDLLAIAAFALAVDLLFVFVSPSQRLLRAVVGLPLVLFLPGYVLLAVLFPAAESGSRGRADSSRGLETGERFALSFGASVALVPPFVIVAELISSGLPTRVILATVSTFVVGGAIAGSARRLRLPPEERFRLPVGRWIDEFYGATVDADSALDAAVTVGLVLAVVVAMSTMGYALLVPTDGESYTSFSLLAENEAGELVAGSYPSELAPGEEQSLVAGIENAHAERLTYTVVVELQEVRTDGSSTTVLREQELERMQVTVDAGETRDVEHAVTPTMTGEDLRLQYYLYEGDAPANADAASADRRLFLWVDVPEQT